MSIGKRAEEEPVTFNQNLTAEEKKSIEDRVLGIFPIKGKFEPTKVITVPRTV